ncbi:MAG: MerR family transcriptional regulator [Dehalococcoidia bacterium]|nr:MerR family transcriptional regulator [Dehalococcoidia bacterium]
MSETPEGHDVYLQIGEAAERCGLTQRTLRYYEEKGLLMPPTRMDGGFRLYSGEDLERVERIKQLKDLLGFSLADIKEMLEAEDVRMQIRAEWRKEADVAEKAAKFRRAREATMAQLAIIEQKMESMEEMRTQLSERLDRYDTWFREHAAELEQESTSTGRA